MNFVALDIGASGARFTTSSGAIQSLPNNVAFITKKDDSGNVVMDPTPVEVRNTDDDILNNLEFIIEKTSGQSDFFPMHGLMGNMAEAYGVAMTYPNSLASKGRQPVNYLSTLIAVTLSRIQYPTLGDNISLYVALPPAELSINKENYVNNVKGSYKVNLPRYMNGQTIEFSIDTVKCYEEGVMAVRSIFQTVRGETRENYRSYIPKTLLSIDIGASTTDIAIVKGGRYLKKSGRTIRKGGNTVRSKMTDRINAKFETEINVDSANMAMAEGRVQYGGTYKDVSDILDEAKAYVAHGIIEDMVNYFSTIDIPLTSIHAIVVSGGQNILKITQIE